MIESPAKLQSLRPLGLEVLGDLMAVAVNSDDPVSRLKDQGRPLKPETGTILSVLAALSRVAHATLFGEETAVELVRQEKPDSLAKGGDYSPQGLDVAGEVTAHGGRVEILAHTPDHFTAALVEKMSAGNAPAAAST